MEEFDEIWSFVEKKLKTSIPTYFKNVLKACGYNNGISIATIVEDDIHYFEGEVRSGSVSNYFKDKNTDENILEGSTKAEKNFEFTRGHRKFLMAIVSFLIKYLERNGPDSFTLELPSKTKKKIRNPVQNVLLPPRKGLTYSSNMDPFLEPFNKNQKNEALINEDLTIQEGILLCRTIMSVINNTPELYAKNAELIKKKVSSLVLFEPIDKSNNSSEKSGEASDEEKTVEQCTKLPPKYIAHVFCPFCSKNIRAFHIPTEKYEALWNTYNFNSHLQIVHPQTDNSEVLEKKEKEEEACEKPYVLPLESTKPTVDMTLKVIVVPAATNDATVVISDKKSDESDVEKSNFANDCPTTSAQLHKEWMDREMDVNSVTISKLRNTCPQSIVCYTDSDSEEGEEEEVKQKLEQPQIESDVIAKPSSDKHNKHDLNKIVSRSHKKTISKSISNIEHSAKLLNEADQKSNLIFPKLGDYVVCTTSIKNSIKWPANTLSVKHFVGKVRGIKEHVGKGEINKTVGKNEILKEVELQFLKKSPYSNFIFVYPQIVDISYVSQNRILNILQDPSKNRRGEFVFKDKSLLNYIF